MKDVHEFNVNSQILNNSCWKLYKFITKQLS